MTQSFLSTTQKTLSFLKKIADEGLLDMKPPFQRNPVWTNNQKSYLIDTILNGFPVPEIYMQVVVDDEGVEKYTVVDGQQRIRACLDFVAGRYSLVLPDKPRDGFRFDELDPSDKKRVFGYQFVVRYLPDIPDATLRDIFLRLNRNVVQLNAQELRHATYWGPFIKSVEKIADDDFWASNGIVTATDIKRMNDAEYVSELAVAYLHGLQNKKATLDRWYALYEDSFDLQSDLIEAFQKITKEVGYLLPNLRKTRWRKKSDFYTLFFFLAKQVERIPFDAATRESLASHLENFATEVDRYIAAGPEANAALSIASYSRAVERAASDLGNRRHRDVALSHYVRGDDLPVTDVTPDPDELAPDYEIDYDRSGEIDS